MALSLAALVCVQSNTLFATASAAVITLICNRYFFYAPLLFLSLNGQNYVFVTVHGHLSILFVCVRENSQSRRGIWMRLLEPTAYRLLNDADCRINVLRFLLGQGVRSTDCRSSGCCYVEMASAPAVPEPSDKCCPVRGSSLREIEPTLFSGKCISLSLSLSLVARLYTCCIICVPDQINIGK